MKTIVLAALILIGCSAPEQTEIQIESKGTLSFSGNYLAPSLTSKDVPPCDDTKTANKVIVQLKDDTGKNYTETVGVTMAGDTFDMNNGIELNEGNYTVEALYLTSADGTILFATPSATDPRGDFAALVDKPVPFSTSVQADAITNETAQTLCYTSIDFNFVGQFGWDGTTDALSPVLLFNQGCDARAVYDNYGVQYPIPADSPIVIPVTFYNLTVIKIYRASDDVLLTDVKFTAENNSGVVTNYLTIIDYDPDTGQPTESVTEYNYTPYPHYIDLNNDGVMDSQDSIVVGTSCF